MNSRSDNRILIVEDDEANAQVMELILNQYNYTNIDKVHSGKETLAYLGVSMSPHDTGGETPKRTDVALVILDVVLPDMSGFKICERIKQVYFRSVAVILITGYDISEYIAQGIEVGADDFLSKPFLSEELVGRVNIAMHRRDKSLDEDNKARSSGNLTKSRMRFKDLQSQDRIGHFDIINMISWSASNMIYIVVDRRDQKRYVLKRLLKQVMEFPDVIHRFNREIEIMKSINHHNVCRIYSNGLTDDGCHFCVMEYIEGQDLETIVNEKLIIDLPTIYRIAEGLAHALDCIHAMGIIHRDIKLNNIYLTHDGIVKVGDFGVAIKMGETRLTQHGYAIGTPVYMSPEQFENEVVTAAADIYSYGATLYHLVAGRPPFTADNVLQLMRKHHSETPVPLTDLRPELPSGWNDLIVHQCLAKNPESRPLSLVQIVSDLLPETRECRQ